MVSNINPNMNYYDLNTNKIITINKNSTTNFRISKVLQYPNVIQGIYIINELGQIYSIINNLYISWNYHDGIPYVNLSCMSESKLHLEPFNIKDLVAYNYIANASDYLERGCRVANIDGNSSNCKYDNLIYLS